MSTSDSDDVLIREYEDSNRFGAWLGKRVFIDKEGNEYTICTDQDGEEWIEE